MASGQVRSRAKRPASQGAVADLQAVSADNAALWDRVAAPVDASPTGHCRLRGGRAEEDTRSQTGGCSLVTGVSRTSMRIWWGHGRARGERCAHGRTEGGRG
jgi:hypothetical protein